MTNDELENLLIDLDFQFVRSLGSPSEWTLHFQHGRVYVHLDEDGDLIRFSTSSLMDLEDLHVVDQQRWMLAAMIHNNRTRLGRLVGIPNLSFELTIWLDGGGKLTKGQLLRAVALAVSQLTHGRASLDELVQSIPERPLNPFPTARIPPPSMN